MTTRRCSNRCCSRAATAAVVAVVAAAAALACAMTSVAADNSDLVGAYCAARPRGCCVGRQDDCSAPILDTTCYCDDFCNRTRSEDCCPDYWSHCHGITAKPAPQRGCYSNGRYYNYGETIKENCNECQCLEARGKYQLMCSSNECLIDPDLLNKLKYQGHRYGWAASNYSDFWGRKYDEGLTLRLGTLSSKKKILLMEPLKSVFKRGSLPRSYDLRSDRDRKNYISQPIDQGWCGASWAITTVQVTTDRFGIMSKGAVNDVLSPQHLLSCNSRSQQGCQGGYLTRAWNWIRKFGLITEKCYPWVGRMTDCEVPKKRKEQIALCPHSSNTDRRFKSRLHRVGPVYRVATEEGIMYEIMTSGSVQALMKVTKDFFMYKTGVYNCSSLAHGSRTGYHSVRIVGWGEEYQNQVLTKYWIVSNSWGRQWGESGYFRILKGANACQIEDFVIAAWVTDFDVTIRSQGYDVFLSNQPAANAV